MSQLRVMIADDEPLARQRLRRMLRREPEVEIVAECGDGPATVAAVMTHAPDLLLLDVQMPELDGFAVLRAVPADRLPVTIFVTAYDQYALRAFEARALDYLLKPFTEARFRAAFERARAAVLGPEPSERVRLLSLLEQIRLEQRDLRTARVGSEPAAADRLLIREEGRVRVLAAAEVDWIEAARNTVRLHAGSMVHVLREPLAALERRLDPTRFARIHRSTVVNLERVSEILPWFSGDGIVVLRDGTRLRVSRSYRGELEARLGQGPGGRPVRP
jgi:two-component system LytT family response regulator